MPNGTTVPRSHRKSMQQLCCHPNRNSCRPLAFNAGYPDWANQPGDDLGWHSCPLEPRSEARGLALGANEPQPRIVIALQNGLTQREVQCMTMRHNEKIGASRRFGHVRVRVSITAYFHTFRFGLGE